MSDDTKNTDEEAIMSEATARVRPHRAPRRLGRTFVTIAFMFGAILLGLSWWIHGFSGAVTVDQVLANIKGVGVEGGGGKGIVVGAIVWSVIVPIIVGSFALIGIRKSQESTWKNSLPHFARAGVTAGLVGVLVAVPVGGAAAISNALSLPEYVESLTSDQNLGDFYRVPTVTSTPEGTPPNLVIIYMESVEDVLTDTAVFEKNMLTPIEKATEGWDTLTLNQPANGGWTLGGIVNTQCGFPLRMTNPDLVGNEINIAGQDLQAYLPGATCLGDVLKEQGYRSVFMGGANTSFAGKGDFLTDHGYDAVLGRSYWMEHGETEMRKDWGLSDRRLMDLAKDQVAQLHESGEPFNLTLLTLDTHPDDYIYPYCNVTTEQEATSIYYCSMQQVAGFVDFMDSQGYLDDTVVVVMGDHLRIMGGNNTFRDQLAAIPDRTIFNRIWSPIPVVTAVDEIDQLSMYPTMLELLGYELSNGRAGVGVSALEADPGRGTVRDLPDGVLDSLVQSSSQEFYDRMWGVQD